ncbi:MAG: 23S rRNA (guanosine(2251)-2'-O)-methyltransferase RlmB [Ilumatobacteraceae bacterium]
MSGRPSGGARRGAGQGRGGRAAAGRRSGPPRSRGAGRTGAVRREGDPKPATREKGLGGEQVEGRQAVRELLLAQRRKVREIWISSELQDSDSIEDIVAIAAANRVQITYVARKRLEAEARSEAPQGVLATAAPLPEADFAQLIRRRGSRPPFLVAVDGVTDPGNLGAIVRSCDGAGVDGVVVPRHRAVHVTPTVAKASAGAIEHVPIAVVSGLPSALQRMRDAGIWVVGLDDAADRSLFDIADLAIDAVCVVLGAEGAGLSRLVRERCDMIVSIPMQGRLSSLNVSAAAALATYEIARHRIG